MVTGLVDCRFFGLSFAGNKIFSLRLFRSVNETRFGERASRCVQHGNRFKFRQSCVREKHKVSSLSLQMRKLHNDYYSSEDESYSSGSEEEFVVEEIQKRRQKQAKYEYYVRCVSVNDPNVERFAWISESKAVSECALKLKEFKKKQEELQAQAERERRNAANQKAQQVVKRKQQQKQEEEQRRAEEQQAALDEARKQQEAAQQEAKAREDELARVRNEGYARHAQEIAEKNAEALRGIALDANVQWVQTRTAEWQSEQAQRASRMGNVRERVKNESKLHRLSTLCVRVIAVNIELYDRESFQLMVPLLFKRLIAMRLLKTGSLTRENVEVTARTPLASSVRMFADKRAVPA